MIYNTDETVKYAKSSKFGLYRYYYYDNDCYQADRRTSRYILIAAIFLILSFLIILIVYLCHPQLETVEMIDNPNYDNTSYTTETFLSINNIESENSTKDTMEDKNIYLENVTNISNVETITAMPFLFDWFQSDFRDSPGEPRKNNRKTFPNMESIPRPFYHLIRDKPPSSFYSSINRNNYNSPHRHRVNSIQDILKHLDSREPEDEEEYKPVKFKGTFRNPKLEVHTPNIYKTKFARLMDPFYQFKPQNPGDVNMLAANSYRFSPFVPSVTLTTEKYPTYEQMASEENPKTVKPVSLLLDIYPMANQQNADDDEGTKPASEQYELQQPFMQFLPYGTKIIPKIPNNWKFGNDQQSPSKMVVQLNLYPKHKYLSQNRRNEPHFFSRRHFSTKRPHYNRPALKIPKYGYKHNIKEFQLQPSFNKKYLHDRKYITRNLTQNIVKNYTEKNDIRPVFEPDMEVGNIEDIIEDYGYPNHPNRRRGNYKENNKTNPDLSMKSENSFDSEFEFGKRLFNYETQTNKNTNNYFQGDAEELQKNLFSTLPPHIVHNKYYTTTMSNSIKNANNWNLNELQNNPNLVNHKID